MGSGGSALSYLSFSSPLHSEFAWFGWQPCTLHLRAHSSAGGRSCELTGLLSWTDLLLVAACALALVMKVSPANRKTSALSLPPPPPQPRSLCSR